MVQNIDSVMKMLKKNRIVTIKTGLTVFVFTYSLTGKFDMEVRVEDDYENTLFLVPTFEMTEETLRSRLKDLLELGLIAK